MWIVRYGGWTIWEGDDEEKANEEYRACGPYGTIREVERMYAIQDRETGTGIDIFDTLEEAERALKEYENDDMKEGVYTPDFYEIVEVEE